MCVGVMCRQQASLWWELTHVESTVYQHSDTVTDSELMIRRHRGRARWVPTYAALPGSCACALVCVCFSLCSPRSTLHGRTLPPPSMCSCWHCSSRWCTPADGHKPDVCQHKPSTHWDSTSARSVSEFLSFFFFFFFFAVWDSSCDIWMNMRYIQAKWF